MTAPPEPPEPPRRPPEDEWAAVREPETEPARHHARNRGTHAAPPSVLRSLVKSFFVVALVAVGVALLVHWRGTPTAGDQQGPAVALPTLTPNVSPAPRPTSRPTPKPTHRPSPQPTPTPVR